MFETFLQIDGKHHLKQFSDLYVPYKARIKENGNVIFFNFVLAKEIGLIPENCNELSEELKQIILSTFALQVINEYDLENKIAIPEDKIKKGEYFATRYLQMQHRDQLGRTSGDGRSLWFGEYNGYDFVGRGTGGTKLSVGTQLYNEHLKTGDLEHYYSSGLAYLGESVHTLFTSEILNGLNISTERTLAIILFNNDETILVKAGKNLLRPAHFFAPLRQKNKKLLSQLFSYFMAKTGAKNLDECFFKIKSDLIYYASLYEAYYMFVWMDFDGDNMLLDGGALDLSTFFRMGALYNDYRIDDIVRWSTNIVEQKDKAALILQNFEQALDFLKNDKQKPLSHYKNSSHQKDFYLKYEEKLRERYFEIMGFSTDHFLWLKEAEKENTLLLFKMIRELEVIKDGKGYFHDLKGVNTQPLLSRDKILINLVFNRSEKDFSLSALFVFNNLETNNGEQITKQIKSFMALWTYLQTQIITYFDWSFTAAENLILSSIHPYKSTGNSDQALKKYFTELARSDAEKFNIELNLFIKSQIMPQQNHLEHCPEIQEIILSHRGHA